MTDYSKRPPIRIELPTPFSVGPVNTYLFTDPEPTLIDCGLNTEECWQALEDGLQQQGLTMADIGRVVITHAHADHMGMAGRIVENSPAQIWVSDFVYEWAVNLHVMWQRRTDFYGNFLRTMGLHPDQDQSVVSKLNSVPTSWDPISADRVTTFAINDVLDLGGYSWQSIYLPGHTNTQTCFYQADTGQFLSADMLLALTPTPVIELPLDGGRERIPGLPQFLESLDRVDAMEIDQVYPGHGDPFGDHRKLIQRQRARIEQRKNECYELVKRGINMVGAILAEMYPHYPPSARFAALGMLVGYLDLLIDEGSVVVQELDGIAHYYASRDS
ncbi:MBL fold metallo-hydrolase [Chloroflexi bacterium TSY]|nr:MBL fold metallo-hydrolase [Chloroflexi bacterium TSY]